MSLLRAVRAGRVEHCNALLTQSGGGNECLLRQKDIEHGQNALHWATQYAEKDSVWIEIMEVLLKKGANIHSKNKMGWTCLHIAALFNRQEAVRLLLDNGADPTKKDFQGVVPLDMALRQGNQETANVHCLI